MGRWDSLGAHWVGMAKGGWQVDPEGRPARSRMVYSHDHFASTVGQFQKTAVGRGGALGVCSRVAGSVGGSMYNINFYQIQRVRGRWRRSHRESTDAGHRLSTQSSEQHPGTTP